MDTQEKRSVQQRKQQGAMTGYSISKKAGRQLKYLANHLGKDVKVVLEEAIGCKFRTEASIADVWKMEEQDNKGIGGWYE